MSILSLNLDNKIFWQLDIQNKTWCIPFCLMAGSFTSCWCTHHLFKGSVSTLTTPCKLNIATTQNYLEHISRFKHGWFGYPCYKFRGYLNKQPRYIFLCLRGSPPPFSSSVPPLCCCCFAKSLLRHSASESGSLLHGWDWLWWCMTHNIHGTGTFAYMNDYIFWWEVEEKMQSSHGSCGCSSESL